MNTVFLKPGREKSVLRRHPWIFSGAVQAVEGSPSPGETVAIRSHRGLFLGTGAWSPRSQIQVRMWSFDPDEKIDAAFFHHRLRRSIAARQKFSQADAACRIVNAESDGLPGLIVDRYADYLVCQFGSAGAEFWKNRIADLLGQLCPCAGIYERSDISAREKEGLAQVQGLLRGKEPPGLLEIQEGPCRFLVDIRRGQKTGFFTDQRDNRSRVFHSCSHAEVLDCFSYTGGFTVNALMGGAKHVTSIDASSSALAMLHKNINLNGLGIDRSEAAQGDVFSLLREYRSRGRQFDVIILDPPKFAESKKYLAAAARAYKDISLLGFALLRPGGCLFTFSCSGLMEADLFQKIVADAALDAGREAHIIGRLCQAEDHPVSLNFPEGAYLKGLQCRVIS